MDDFMMSLCSHDDSVLLNLERNGINPGIYEEFINQLICINNDNDHHEYIVDFLDDVYTQALEKSTEQYGRLPTMNEISDLVYEHNYGLVMELAIYDVDHGFDGFGYAEYYRNSIHDREELIEYTYDAWCGHLSIDLQFGVIDFVSLILSANQHSYYCGPEVILKQYSTEDNYRLCINDCQNLLFPQWHDKILNDIAFSSGTPGQSHKYLSLARITQDEVDKEGFYEEEK